MKMDEFDGKQFLAAVRGADFAHAGETDAIDLVFNCISAKPDWQVLDIGCGRGGTANYVNQHGWGCVHGIDIDESSISYARSNFPSLRFDACEMEQVGTRFPNQFDLLYLFNVFYAASQKTEAMTSFRKAAKSGGLLCIFDYVYYQPEKDLPAVFQGQRPATVQELRSSAESTGWSIIENKNLDREYIAWYQSLLCRFDNADLYGCYSAATVEDVRMRYAELLLTLENGTLGGCLLIAQAV